MDDIICKTNWNKEVKVNNIKKIDCFEVSHTFKKNLLNSLKFLNRNN